MDRKLLECYYIQQAKCPLLYFKEQEVVHDSTSLFVHHTFFDDHQSDSLGCSDRAKVKQAVNSLSKSMVIIYPSIAVPSSSENLRNESSRIEFW